MNELVDKLNEIQAKIVNNLSEKLERFMWEAEGVYSRQGNFQVRIFIPNATAYGGGVGYDGTPAATFHLAGTHAANGGKAPAFGGGGGEVYNQHAGGLSGQDNKIGGWRSYEGAGVMSLLRVCQ